jgi:hypothetical protein
LALSHEDELQKQQTTTEVLKTNMSKFTTAAWLAAGVALITHAVQAGNTDLVLGFTGNGASADAVVDLGSAAQFGIGGSGVVDLIDSRGAAYSASGLAGSDFMNLLNSVFATGVNGAGMTLAGGQGGISTFFYLSQNRGMAGSNTGLPLSAKPFSWGKSAQQSVGGYPAGVLNGAGISFQGGNAPVSLSLSGSINTTSYSYLVLGVNNTLNSVASYQTVPGATVAGGLAYEDVWLNSAISGSAALTDWSYQGFLTLDLTGGTTALLTFTPAPVPEPSVLGLLGGLGCLALVQRYRRNRKAN